MVNTDTPADSRVLLHVHDGVAEVSLNRPEKMNALDLALFRGLISAGQELITRKDIRAVVLHGQGRAFCVGLDLNQFAKMSAGLGAASDIVVEEPSPIGGATALGQQSVRVWSQIGAPVIAAIHGYALGGGLQLALGADIRVVEPSTLLGVSEIEWGLVPDMAGTQLLPELVGRDMAKLLTFTGRRISGTEAVRVGLATVEHSDALGEARRLASEIAGRGQQAMQSAKRLLDSAGHLDLAAGLQAEQREIRQLLAARELAELAGKRLDELRSRSAGGQ
jgi:enoyl-CoA hydratase/carnithine racemase